MRRLESKKSNRKMVSAATVEKRKKTASRIERFSVSQTKARLSEVLRMARNGQPVIITDHGQDVARIEGVSMPDQLSLIPAITSFTEVKNVRAPTPEHAPMRSALELLEQDRARR